MNCLKTRLNCHVIFVSLIMVISFGLMAGPLFAQAQAQETELVVVRAARMLDPERGEVIRNPVVVIEGETIKEVGVGLAVPSGAKVIDLGEMILLPGLIDTHTHLLQNYDGDIGGNDNMTLTVANMSTASRALLGTAMGRENLEAGITSVRDVGNSGWNGDVALRDAINRGWVVGPRIFASTRALAPTGGQFGGLSTAGQSLIEHEYAAVHGPENARQAVRQAFYDGANLIKVIVNAGPRVLTQEEMNAIVDEAHKVGGRVAAHATSDLATRIAAEAGVDSIEHGYSIPDDALKLMAEKGIYLVPTDYPEEFYMAFASSEPSERQQRLEGVQRVIASHRERLARAIRLGVPIVYGSDEYYEVPGYTRGQASLLALKAYQDSGMSPIEVLRAATINAADLVNRSDQLGTIAAGKFADLIAVEGDPLADVADLQRVRFVMKGGKVIRDDRLGR